MGVGSMQLISTHHMFAPEKQKKQDRNYSWVPGKKTKKDRIGNKHSHVTWMYQD